MRDGHRYDSATPAFGSLAAPSQALPQPRAERGERHGIDRGARIGGWLSVSSTLLVRSLNAPVDGDEQCADRQAAVVPVQQDPALG